MNAIRGLGRILAWPVAAWLLFVAITGGSRASTSSGERAGGESADEVRIFTYGQPSSIDPAGWGEPPIMAQLFERLTDVDANSKVIPALAQSWVIDPGARRVVFTLRPGLRFSDGTPLTAADVIHSWMRLLDPDLSAPNSWILSDVEGAVAHRLGSGAPVGLTASDPLHVEVRLAHAANDFPAIAASAWLGVVPPSVTGSLTVGEATRVVVSGAYRVRSWTASEMTLSANPHYWAGPPAIENVRLLGSVEDGNAVRAFMDEKIDYAPIREGDAGWVATDADLGPQLIEQPDPSIVLYGFAATKPPFDDPGVRRAFAEAVDWTRVVAWSDLPYVPATGMVPPGVPGRSDKDFSPPYDPEEARRLLAEAGYPGGVGFPPVTLSTDGFAWDRSVTAAWETELGVKVQVEEVYDVDRLARLEHDPPNIWATSWRMDYAAPNDFLGVLAGVGQENNYSRWSSREFEEEVQAARATTDPAASQAAFERAEALLQSELPLFAVAYGAPVSALARTGLVGEGANGMGLVRLGSLSWSEP